MSLVERLAGRIAREIATGGRPAGTALLSIRRAAAEYGVSKNTVIEAYARLVESGAVSSRPGSGFTVRPSPDTQLHGRPKHVAEAVDIASLLNAQLGQDFDIRVGDGRPPPSWTEESEVRRHLVSFGRALTSGSHSYGTALGFLPLREALSRKLADQRIQVGEKQILLTFGANHALDLIIRAFLAPGDAVLVDEPGYYPLFAKLKLHQVQMLGVRRNVDGPDLADLESKVRGWREEDGGGRSPRPRIFFTQSIAHNPTGSSIRPSIAHGLLQIAAEHDVVIVEDEPFADLASGTANRLATLDQLRRVISVGTFSKTLSASMRTGYIAATPERIGALAELKMLTTVNSSGHIERLLHKLLIEGHYDRHLKRLAQRIEAAHMRVRQGLADVGARTFSDDPYGYYIYVLLPERVDSLEFARRGAKEGIFIASGSVFCLDKQNPRGAGFRINVGRADSPAFLKFLGDNLR